MEKVPLGEFFMVYGTEPLADLRTPEIFAVEKLMSEFETHEDQGGEFVQQYK